MQNNRYPHQATFKLHLADGFMTSGKSFNNTSGIAAINALIPLPRKPEANN